MAHNGALSRRELALVAAPLPALVETYQQRRRPCRAHGPFLAR